MLESLDPAIIYKAGFVLVIVLAMTWSFLLDKNKPPTTGEFIAKLFARALFLAFMLVIMVGFLYLALGSS